MEYRGCEQKRKVRVDRQKLKLKRGSELSEFVINTNSDAIKKYFDEKGFQNAEVSVEQVNDTTVHNAVNVTFVVNKKSRVKIGKISFEGNEVFSDKRLRKTFKRPTRRVLIFSGLRNSSARSTKRIRKTCSITTIRAATAMRSSSRIRSIRSTISVSGFR